MFKNVVFSVNDGSKANFISHPFSFSFQEKMFSVNKCYDYELCIMYATAFLPKAFLLPRPGMVDSPLPMVL